MWSWSEAKSNISGFINQIPGLVSNKMPKLAADTAIRWIG